MLLANMNAEKLNAGTLDLVELSPKVNTVNDSKLYLIKFVND